MKVLFVCVANVGRSQMAEAFFNHISEHQAESAGTMANELLARQNPPTNRLADSFPMGQTALRCMREDEGIDMSQRERKQLTEEIYSEADKVVMIARRETWPDYVAEDDPRVIVWDVYDPVRTVGERPDDKDEAFRMVRETKDKVKNLVQGLVRDLSSESP